MPDIDAGTYFFTGIVPLCNEGIVERGELKSSPVHIIREVLETLPTALQSHATEKTGLNSPFALNRRTHFARIIVLDQPNFNGRDRSNALVNAVARTDLLAPQPVDQLTCPYLLVMIEFDHVTDGDASDPHGYFQDLWHEMEPQLRSIFQYCYGFEAVGDADDFGRYMVRCQVETTMPFHDYWYVPPKLTPVSVPLLVALPVAGLVLPLVARALGWLGWAWGWAIALALLLAILGLVADYWIVMRKGNKPFPAPPEATLRHVLKGLYLQQAFTRFAIAQQGRAPSERGAAFRAFLDTHHPDDLDKPTQPPGVIRSRLSGHAA